MQSPIERMIDKACRCKKCNSLPLKCRCERNCNTHTSEVIVGIARCPKCDAEQDQRWMNKWLEAMEAMADYAMTVESVPKRLKKQYRDAHYWLSGKDKPEWNPKPQPEAD